MLAFRIELWYPIQATKGGPLSWVRKRAEKRHERLYYRRNLSMDLIKELNKETLAKEKPAVQIGDTVRVHVKVKEGSRERIQVFEGTVIAKKHGGIEETITVRRISYGIGVEKVFPVYSPSITTLRSFAAVRFAVQSCTSCAIALVRALS